MKYQCKNPTCVHLRKAIGRLKCRSCGEKTEDIGKIPTKPGYYWALWTVAQSGTFEGDEQTPSRTWEIVQVNVNQVDWDYDPQEEETLSVSIPGYERRNGETTSFGEPLSQPWSRTWERELKSTSTTKEKNEKLSSIGRRGEQPNHDSQLPSASHRKRRSRV